MHNPAKLEFQQERKRFVPTQRAACRSERMEERKTDRSKGEGEDRSEYTNQQCKRERKIIASEPCDEGVNAQPCQTRIATTAQTLSS